MQCCNFYYKVFLCKKCFTSKNCKRTKYIQPSVNSIEQEEESDDSVNSGQLEEPYANLHKIEDDISNKVDAIYTDDADNNMEDFYFLCLILILSLAKMKKLEKKILVLHLIITLNNTSM